MKIIQYIKENWYELLITFCLFSNLYSLTFPRYFYFIGLALLFIKMLQCRVNMIKANIVFGIFLFVVWLSSIINIVVDQRLVLFTGIIIMCSPLFTNLRWHLYKKKLLRNIFIGAVCTVVASLIAEWLGINYQIIRLGGSMEAVGGVDEFSGFAYSPMWNSAAAAVSTIYFAYLIFRDTKKNLWQWLFYVAMFVASIHICLISASRSAFVASMIVSLLFMLWVSRNIGKKLRYAIIFAFLGAALMPFFTESSERMMQKQERQEKTGTTSRDDLWAMRWAEFESSPIFGVGFAVHGLGDEQEIGRDESGSSWLAALAQAGAVGFIVLVIIWLRTFTRISRINYDKDNILTYGLFLFFTMHSIFEGYMFQGGWYMCVICWMTVGVIIEARRYRPKPIVQYNNTNS